MHAVVVSIGTEVVRGELLNTNAEHLAARLTELGLRVVEHVSVEDDHQALAALYARLAAWSSPLVVVATGGLGPTTDDFTADSVARFLGVPLERDEAAYAALTARLARVGREVSASNAKQCDLPRGAEVLPNAKGTAPGFAVDLRPSVRAFFMPGVPREMRTMLEGEVLPRLAGHADGTRHQIHLRTFGLPESTVGDRLAGLEEAHPGLTLGYRAHFPEVEVKVLVEAESADEARARAVRVAAEVEARLGDVIYGGKDDTFVGVVSRRLRDAGLTVALAESCTGGAIASMLTRVPGASAIVMAGVVSYSNQAKHDFLGVPNELIEAHGAVSEPVARAMAEGMRQRAGVDVALAVTGIAGPDGGTAEKPVGTVWLAVAMAGETRAVHRVFPGFDRARVQTLAAYVGLAMLAEAARR